MPPGALNFSNFISFIQVNIIRSQKTVNVLESGHLAAERIAKLQKILMERAAASATFIVQFLDWKMHFSIRKFFARDCPEVREKRKDTANYAVAPHVAGARRSQARTRNNLK